jgi:hypothetical protein
VSTSAEHFAARARSMSEAAKPRSRMTYSWNQKGFATSAATSSIEQIDMVESVNGTPKRSAARAARISPSAQFKPVRPVGASATGMRASSPTMVMLVERRSTSMPTRWRSASNSRSARFARSVHSA